MISLYDTTGQPIVYVDPACQGLYDAAGRLVGWFEEELLYATNGRYLGWLHQGWVYDRTGNPALFMATATGGPNRPDVDTSQPTPCYWLQRAMPRRAATRRQARPARRRRATSWSPLSGPAYFAQ